MIFLLIFCSLIWIFIEYWQIRSGFLKIADKSVIVEKFESVKTGDEGESRINGKVVRAIYLGKKKIKCKKDLEAQICLLRLKFLSIDGDGNPLVYWAYGGAWQGDKKYQVRGVYPQEESEFEPGSGVVLLNDEELLKQLDLTSEVGLAVMTQKSDLLLDDNAMPLIDLEEKSYNRVVDFLNKIEQKEINQLISFFHALFYYRDIVLPVVFIEFL